MLVYLLGILMASFITAAFFKPNKLIALSSLILSNTACIFLDLFSPGTWGWDLMLFRAVEVAVYRGGNPYYTGVLQALTDHSLSMPYPMLWAKLFSFLTYPLCWYLLYYAVIFVFIYCIIPKQKGARLYLLTLLYGGFFSFAWILKTGNISMVSFLFIALWFVLILKTHFYSAAFFLGLAGSIKLLPLLYVLPLLVVFILKKDWARFSGVLGILLGSFFSVYLISYLMYPQFFSDFIFQLFGLIPNQHTPFTETLFCLLDATPLLGLQAFLDFIFSVNLVYFSKVFWGVCLILYLLYVVIKRTQLLHYIEKNGWEIFYFMSVLILILTLPRLKPYSFIEAIIPLYYLTKNFNWRSQRWLLMAAVWSQFLFVLVSYSALILQSSVPPVLLFLNWAQPIGLLFCVIVLNREKKFKFNF
ncbi:hypothetical protein DID80_07815 [Candidatus Marinamargulisbacteria bacterium SCGC AAA071-K20]|nr:hypothetical protein DID80_07815 [Candidatus Marinamargulisbacteria bacterium SCGC AAA071-K20]